MTEPNFQELAKQGNPAAIASLLHQHLPSPNTTVTTQIEDGCLEVLLEGDPVPDRFECVDFVRNELATLEPESIHRVKVDGRKTGDSHSAWSQEFGLEVGSYSMLTFPEEFNSNVPPPSNPTPLSNYKQEIESPALKIENDRRLRFTFIVVGLVTAILAVSIAVFAGKMTGLIAIPGENDKNETPEPKLDPFREAVNKAISASKLVQSAKTEADWNEAASQWQEAIDLMHTVPQSHPNHQLAQKKAVEYEKNLKYAQDSALNSSR